MKKHSIILKTGIFTSAVSSHIFRFHGATSHASEPEKGINPSLAIATLLSKSVEFNQLNIERDDFCLVTPIHTIIGSPAYGIAAGNGECHFTIRALDDAHLNSLRSKLISLAEELCEREGLSLSQESLQNFHANYNDANIVDLVKQSAGSCNLEVNELTTAFSGGEDFGLFTAQFPCCMFGLGSGEDTVPLHSASYDFPDELIETGVRIFDGVVNQVLR